ncbi:MAG: SARP family transcriptional regulator [Actinomycetota bacterium]|nr:SARP family transcriptional regulator [Actinomycetota bacterium]
MTTSPRGHKPWALLAYVLRSETPPSRERLAGLLFEDADDPLGALRWSLSEVRRMLGHHAKIHGDPLHLDLPDDASVDVDVLSNGTWMEAVALSGLGRDLIEGVHVQASPAFELWLENERRHVSGLTEAVLHEAALACLARGEAQRAADHAVRLVSLNRFEENSHVLLVRCLRLAGRHDEAARQVAACTELFREELGVEPSVALRAAAEIAAPPAVGHDGSPAAILARLEAGESAVAAGALHEGIESLRAAADAARLGVGRDLHSRALVSLGSALVHGVRGRDEEGVTALYEAVEIAEQLDTPVLAATALREIAWVEFLRAHYDRAETSLARAENLAEGHDLELAWIQSVQGACRTDTGDYRRALPVLESAIERADRAGAAPAGTFARTMLGRLYLLRSEFAEAAHVLDDAMRLARSVGWTSFIPLPEALRAEVTLVEGDVDSAEEAFTHSFALGCQLGDPCWESIAQRGLGLVAATRGHTDRAIELLDDAARRCRRLPDTYLWLDAYALDALCGVGIPYGAPAARRWVDALETTASHNGMRELVVRAALHRARLGDRGAIEGALALAAGIDNPVLEELFSKI